MPNKAIFDCFQESGLKVDITLLELWESSSENQKLNISRSKKIFKQPSSCRTNRIFSIKMNIKVALLILIIILQIIYYITQENVNLENTL